MNEGRNAGYYYQFSNRQTGEILLEGFVTGGNKQDCINSADIKALEAGLKPYQDENIKRYLKRVDIVDAADTKLKILRVVSGMSQRDLAEAAGVNLRTLQDYEQGKKRLAGAAAETVARIAKVLGVTVEELINTEVE